MSDSDKMQIMEKAAKIVVCSFDQLGRRCNKSNVKSLQFRVEGNGYFASLKYGAAFSAYSFSAYFAEPDTEFLGLAYANRSAALFELGFYESCLENIKLARESKYPKKLLPKLENREERCHRALQKGKKSDRKIELTGNPHPSIPFISDRLYYNRKKKSIFTSKDLAPGDLVAIEEPFCAARRELRLNICWNCLKFSFVTIPCKRGAVAFFCSEDCRVKYEMWYKYECPITNLIIQNENGAVHLIMRMLFTAINLFQSVDDFRKFCECPDNKKDNIFEMDKSSFDAKEYFKLICGTNTYRNDPEADYMVFVNAAIAKIIILEYTDLKNVFSTDAEIKFLTEQLLHFSKIFHYKQVTEKFTFGCRMYGLSKYLRHSCEPNVVRVCSEGGKSLIFVLRPIPPNKELLENYWESSQDWLDVGEWNRISRKLFNFTCVCKRCILGRRFEFYLDMHPRIPFNEIEADFQRIDEFNRKYAEENFQRFANFIQKYNKYPNCRQITFAVFCLKRCLEIMHTTSVDYL